MTDRIPVETLVENANDLLETGHYRASVMEAMTALEERVNEVVFHSLENRKELPDDLIKWLRAKTKNSFDDKLHPIGAFALGKPIQKGEKLWSDYKKARNLRHEVSHTAQRISKSDARFVIQTVKEWLYFLEGAQGVKASNEAPDLTLEFLSLHAFLTSRFNFPKNSRPISMQEATKNALRRGEMSEESAQLIITVVKLRDEIALGFSAPPETLVSLIYELKILLKEMKGIEIGG
jgi:hypothetical protein